MLLSKFNNYKIFFLMTLSLSVNATFTDMECLNATFANSVAHKGAPLGLTNTIVKVNKDKCLITIEHEELKFRKNKWIIDICREPIHIKSGTGSIDVLKKTGNCKSAQNNKEFCKAVRKIELVLQDDGLIFADGEKEDLSREHGQLYCTFLILKSYLNEDFIYSRDGKYENTLIKSPFQNKKETCDVKPQVEKIERTSAKEVKVDETSTPTTDTIPETKEEGRF